MAEHWRLKPKVSWVRLLVTAGLFPFLYFCLITTKFIYLEFVTSHTMQCKPDPIPQEREGLCKLRIQADLQYSVAKGRVMTYSCYCISPRCGIKTRVLLLLALLIPYTTKLLQVNCESFTSGKLNCMSLKNYEYCPCKVLLI